jgi:hypothetical protein
MSGQVIPWLYASDLAVPAGSIAGAAAPVPRSSTAQVTAPDPARIGGPLSRVLSLPDGPPRRRPRRSSGARRRPACSRAPGGTGATWRGWPSRSAPGCSPSCGCLPVRRRDSPVRSVDWRGAPRPQPTVLYCQDATPAGRFNDSCRASELDTARQGSALTEHHA